MSEEIKNDNEDISKVPEGPMAEPVQETPVPEAAQTPEAAPQEAANAIPQEVPEVVPQEAPAQPATPETQPQIIIQKERGFSHYVGFTLLCVLCVVFFFIPGIAISYGVHCIANLTAAVAWIFSALLSVIIWFIFKLKIKGFKKSFYFYIGLCVLVTILLVAIEILTEKANVFASIFSMLVGAA